MLWFFCKFGRPLEVHTCFSCTRLFWELDLSKLLSFRSLLSLILLNNSVIVLELTFLEVTWRTLFWPVAWLCSWPWPWLSLDLLIMSSWFWVGTKLLFWRPWSTLGTPSECCSSALFSSGSGLGPGAWCPWVGSSPSWPCVWTSVLLSAESSALFAGPIPSSGGLFYKNILKDKRG